MIVENYFVAYEQDDDVGFEDIWWCTTRREADELFEERKNDDPEYADSLVLCKVMHRGRKIANPKKVLKK